MASHEIAVREPSVLDLKVVESMFFATREYSDDIQTHFASQEPRKRLFRPPHHSTFNQKSEPTPPTTSPSSSALSSSTIYSTFSFVQEFVPRFYLESAQTLAFFIATVTPPL